MAGGVARSQYTFGDLRRMTVTENIRCGHGTNNETKACVHVVFFETRLEEEIGKYFEMNAFKIFNFAYRTYHSFQRSFRFGQMKVSDHFGRALGTANAGLQMDDSTTWCHVNNSFGGAKSALFVVTS